ncbi:hypothetical protein [Paenibacillus thalictri]|uniref:hypothetical protein n=1 Tax=Paenibacillus thalictri TaxID=2527873 RepID=UPI0013EF1848|nr:hypothetical protein [Paenibacillus thalictri]
MADAIRQAVGREASRVRSYRTENGETVHIMQVVISRLEAVPLTELIVAADPQAIVDVVPLPGSFGLRRSIRLAKRHSRRDLPDVTKYGNELNED